MSQTELVYQDATSRHLQEFRNMRIILLDTIWELLINAQLKSKDTGDKQALKSLKQCKDSLDNCLLSLQESEYALYNICNTFENKKFDDTILDKYMERLRQVIRFYIEDDDDPDVKTLEAMLVENIGVMQLGIQMLELLTGKDNKILKKLKEKVFSNAAQEKQPDVVMKEESKPKVNEETDKTSDMLLSLYNKRNGIKKTSSSCSRLSGGRKTILRMTGRESEFSRDFAKKVQKFRIEVDKNVYKLRNATEAMKPLENTSPRLSNAVTQIQTETMKEAATCIIDNLLSGKPSSTAPAKCDIYLTGLRIIDIGLSDLWLELCELHNQILYNSKNIKLEELKDTLIKFYLTKMQLLLQKNTLKFAYMTSRRVSRRPTLSMTSSLRTLVSQNLPENRVILMHKQFYTAQMEKIKVTRKRFNIRRLYTMLMNRELPESASEHDLFSVYESDPEHYNVLMMIINRDSQRENLLQIIERNYGEIRNLIDRGRRRTKMFKSASRSTIRSRQSCQQARSTIFINRRTIFSEEYLQEERAKWAKYFADQELTPTERNLAKIRRQKQRSLDRQKRLEHKQKVWQERENRRGIRPITSLYDAPRVTHRVRQAMQLMAEEETHILNTRMPPKKFTKTETLEREEHPLADALLASESWTSCCSECRRLQHTIAPDSALGRFHRTQQQIMSAANYCDYNAS